MLSRLKNFLRRIFRYLRGKDHPYVPSTLTFPLLDTKTIAENLELERLGMENGRRGEPSPKATAFDPIEHRIVTLIDIEKNKAVDLVNRLIQSYESRIATTDLQLFITDTLSAAKKTLAEFKTTSEQALNDLFLERRTLVEIQCDLKDFKQKHGLNRAARLPEAPILYVGITMFALVVETVLNGFFLGEAHTFGLIGGIVEALSISMINVGTGFLFGWYVIRNIFHRRAAVRMFTMIIFLVYLVFIVVLNLAFAHYRDLYVVRLGEGVGIQVLYRLLENPLGISDIKSWYLFALGMIFWIVALFDGFRMDDLYPGYGAIYRRFNAAVDRYRDAHNDVLEELEEGLKVGLRRIKELQEKLQARKQEYIAIKGGMKRAVESFDHYMEHLEQVGRELLEIYRTANKRAREESGTPAAPLYFNEPWILERPTSPNIIVLNEKEVERRVKDAIKKLEVRIEEIDKMYQDALKKFKNIEDLTAESWSEDGTSQK